MPVRQIVLVLFVFLPESVMSNASQRRRKRKQGRQEGEEMRRNVSKEKRKVRKRREEKEGRRNLTSLSKILDASRHQFRRCLFTFLL
jgi:hypothetical protein